MNDDLNAAKKTLNDAMNADRAKVIVLSRAKLPYEIIINNCYCHATKTMFLQKKSRCCNHAQEWDDALQLYETGLEQMMSLLQQAVGDQHSQLRKWLGENMRRHLTRAEYVCCLLLFVVF
jgi:hypothetical protein